MLDVTKLLEEIQAAPYAELIVHAPHTGVVCFPELQPGDRVSGPSGVWREKPGALLATVERERNPHPIRAVEAGEVTLIHRELEGQFVQAGCELVRMRHYLSREEVLAVILKKALHLFLAPERAKYYFHPSVDMKIKVSGCKSVTVQEGTDLFIMSRMKRETPFRYSGPEGIIYAVYFSHNDTLEAGQPLIGICPPQMVGAVENVVMRVQTEWRGEA